MKEDLRYLAIIGFTSYRKTKRRWLRAFEDNTVDVTGQLICALDWRLSLEVLREDFDMEKAMNGIHYAEVDILIKALDQHKDVKFKN